MLAAVKAFAGLQGMKNYVHFDQIISTTGYQWLTNLSTIFKRANCKKKNMIHFCQGILFYIIMNPFHATSLFLYFLKISENQKCSGGKERDQYHEMGQDL